MRSISGRNRIFGHEDGLATCDGWNVKVSACDVAEEEQIPDLLTWTTEKINFWLVTSLRSSPRGQFSICLRFYTIPEQIRLLCMPSPSILLVQQMRALYLACAKNENTKSIINLRCKGENRGTNDNKFLERRSSVYFRNFLSFWNQNSVLDVTQPWFRAPFLFTTGKSQSSSEIPDWLVLSTRTRILARGRNDEALKCKTVCSGRERSQIKNDDGLKQ